MNEGILGAIANPQLADVAGALNYRQAQMDKDEAKRKEITRNKLIAQAIPNMAEDSPIRKLFEEDPQAGALMAKTLNIPLNDGEAFEKFRGQVRQLASVADTDPRMAIEHAKQIQAENQRNGVQDQNLDRWVSGIDTAMQNNDENGITTQFNALHVMDQHLNPTPKKDLVKLGQGEILLDPVTGKQIANNPKTFNPNDPENKVKVHSGTILPDGTTVSLMSDGSTQVQSGEGQSLTGKDRVEAIKQARQYGIDVAGGTAGAKKTAESQAGVVSTAKQSENRAAQLSTAIGEAEKLLPKATGSYLGAATDIAGRVVGVTTESSQAAAKLDTLAGWLTANVPRMEGPQSDRDVQAYQTMAAKVGDRTSPVAERQAALSVLKNLQSKYSDLNKNIIGGEQNTFGTKTGSSQSAADRLKALTGGQ